MIDLKDLNEGDRITVAGTFQRWYLSGQGGDSNRIIFDIAGVSYGVPPSAVVSFERAWRQGDIAYSEAWGCGEVLKVQSDRVIVLWDDAAGPGSRLDGSYPTKYLSRQPWPTK